MVGPRSGSVGDMVVGKAAASVCRLECAGSRVKLAASDWTPPACTKRLQKACGILLIAVRE